MSKSKHIKWKLKSLLMGELERRGASFIENKYVIPMVEDAYRIYELHPHKDLDELIEKIVDYYLDEIYGLSESEEEIMEGGKEGKEEATNLEEELLKTKQKDSAGEIKEVGEAGKVVCQICGARFKVLYPHLLAKHELKPDQYRKMFPKAPLRAGVPEQLKLKKEHSHKERPMSVANIDFKNRIIVLAENIYRKRCL